MSAAPYAEQAMALFSELAYDTTIERHADTRYGPLPVHTLDIYLPFKVGARIERLPVLVFIHGGGFTQGRKKWNALIATVPAILVNIAYQLIPSVQWPVIKKGQVKDFGKIPLSAAQQFYSLIS